jgi:hypothetical protein
MHPGPQALRRIDINSCRCILQFIKPTLQVAAFGIASTVQKPTGPQEKPRRHKGCFRDALRDKSEKKSDNDRSASRHNTGPQRPRFGGY